LAGVDFGHWLAIVGRTTAVYVVIIAGFRVSGRRLTAQLEPFDFVIILLVANAVQNAMVGADVTLGGGIVSAATLFVLNYVVSELSYRFAPVRRFVEGSGRVLILDGKFVAGALQREHLTQDDITRIVESRLNQDTSVADIEKAVLEIDGTVSIVKRDHTMERSTERLPSRHVRRRYRPAA
jgi:uncharacterized membrane protein YcaP (DUF421 family)